MKPIFFFAKELKFYFGENSKLLVYDSNFLPYSWKFLSRIRKEIPFSTSVIGYPPEESMLLLNKQDNIVILPITKVFASYRQDVEFFSFYNNKIRNDILELANNNLLIKGGNLEIRVCPAVKGAMVLCNKEDRSEALEIAIGMLNLYSPEEIIKEFM